MRKLASCVCLAGALIGCGGGQRGGTGGDPADDDGDGSGSGSNEQPPLDVSHATACQGSTTLQGVEVPGKLTIPSRSYDVAGALFCFELDARQNIHIAHFAAGTEYEQASASSFRIALLDASNSTMLREGWDVAIGNTDPSAFANLEYAVTAGQQMSVKLFVGAKQGTATTVVDASIFEPFE